MVRRPPEVSESEGNTGKQTLPLEVWVDVALRAAFYQFWQMPKQVAGWTRGWEEAEYGGSMKL